MKSILVIIFLILFSLPAFTQQFIGKSKAGVRDELQKYNTPAGYKSGISGKSDSTILFAIKGTGNLQATMLFLFDRKGNCTTEKIMTTCDSCLQLYLQPVLANTKYHWKQINENQYVSDFESRLMLELPPENFDHSFRIMRMDWSRELYDILMEK